MIFLKRGLFFIFFLLYTLGIAQEQIQFFDGTKKLEQLLLEKTDSDKPGGALAIFHKGELIFSGNYGSADLSTKKKIDKNSQFYIASLSKSFTSAAILYLWEENRISLDAKVSSILKGFENLKEVTIRQLLDHSSGVPDYYDFMDTENTTLSNNDVIEFAKTATLLFAPGTDYAYSNTGYVLLATIVEKISEQPYEDFIRKIFLKPLKMNKTLVYDKDDKKNSNKVIGYNTEGGVDDYKHFTYGAGGMYSTIDDLSKWYMAVRANKFLDSETWQIAFTPPNIPKKRTYLAMGWNYEDCGPNFPNLYSIASFGFMKGFQSYLFMVPELDFTIIMLSNSGDMLMAPYDIMDIYFRKY